MGPPEVWWTLGMPTVANGEVSPGDQRQEATQETSQQSPGGYWRLSPRSWKSWGRGGKGWGARTGVNTDSPNGSMRLEGRWGRGRGPATRELPLPPTRLFSASCAACNINEDREKEAKWGHLQPKWSCFLIPPMELPHWEPSIQKS